MAARIAKRLSPQEAIAAGHRALAKRRAAARLAARQPWTAPEVVETTVPVVSRPAPSRWLRVWRAPQVIVDAVAEAERRGYARAVNDLCARDEQPATVSVLPTTIEVKKIDNGVGQGEVVEQSQAEQTKTSPSRPHAKSLSDQRFPTQVDQVVDKVDELVQRPAQDRKLTRDACRATEPTAAAQPEKSVDLAIQRGAYRLTDLTLDQCRFACTPHSARADQHRFCGQPVQWLSGKPTSWCAAHLPVVTGTKGRHAGGASAADAAAGRCAEPAERTAPSSAMSGAWR